ncbi:MAG: ATP synthase F1 subunit gamma [Candidatus Theseobacter exili]|nr:ATP synthase F1 subunit gamma [Candidatus Theseobacter exili]
MENLRDIKTRISGVQEIQKITRAMKMVATSKFKKAEKRIETTRGYIEEIFRIYNRVLHQEPMRHDPFYEQRKEKGTTGILIVTADKGLCGGFNANMIRYAKEVLAQALEGGGSVNLLLAGKKGRSHFIRNSDYEILMEEIGLFSALSYLHARTLADCCIKNFLSGNVNRVWMVFTGYRSAGDFKPCYKEILPLKDEEADKESRPKGPGYIYDPDRQEVLAHLLPAFLTSRIFLYLLQSETAEHVARMNAMSNASNNAEELIGDLKIAFNKARQAAITKEILDIVGGAEALGG